MKTLIYSTVGGNYGYVQMFNMCLQTLLKRGEYNGDYIVFSAFPKNDFNNIKNRDKFIVIDFPESGSTWEKFSPFGLSVENYIPDICKYDKVLYLNIDTVFFSSVYKIFDSIGEGITGCPELSMKDSNYHGKKYHTQYDTMMLQNSAQYGINAGILGFKPSRENMDILKEAYKLYIDKPDGETHEQPAINYTAWKHGKLETTLGYPIIQLVSPENIPDVNKICVAHFICGISNAQFKLNRMSKYANDCI
jgi:lipopolysaccharide biosynthesis glycosyltransferase